MTQIIGVIYKIHSRESPFSPHVRAGPPCITPWGREPDTSDYHVVYRKPSGPLTYFDFRPPPSSAMVFVATCAFDASLDAEKRIRNKRREKKANRTGQRNQRNPSRSIIRLFGFRVHVCTRGTAAGADNSRGATNGIADGCNRCRKQRIISTLFSENR